jgi:hypothetical protein
VVDDNYWKRAEAYLHHFLAQKAKQQGGASSSAAKDGSAPDKMRPPPQDAAGIGSSSAAPTNQSQISRTSAQKSGQSVSAIRQEISTKRQALGGVSGSQYSPPPTSSATVPSTTALPPVVAPPATSKSKQSSTTAKRVKMASVSPATVPRVKSTTTPTPAAAATPVVPVETPKPPEAPPVTREYSEFMEMVDHAVNYDWTTAGMLLGQKTHAQLSEEQRNLLYNEQSAVTRQQRQQQALEPSFPLAGWGERNIISPRVAWARIRLLEQRMEQASPPVTGGHLSLTPPNATTPATQGATPSTATKPIVWLHEEKAEEDKTLAVLSEGVQIYLKSVLEKALFCARQRQNIDGIRLWHQQSVPGAKPPLSLRLGCDVSRQAAQAAGNAAMTCKRMEEALGRQSDVPAGDRVLNEKTMSNAKSMSDLALRPLLARGADSADYQAKRSFEVYGGKGSSDPPLGRVPKQAKLEVVDFQMGMNLAGSGRHRAGPLSSSFTF